MKKLVLFVFAMISAIASMADNEFSCWSNIDFISPEDLYSAGKVFYTYGDTVSAAKCFEKASEFDAEAQYVYGLFTMGGYGGVKKNIKKGLRLVERAAKNAQPDALAFLGEIYEFGEYEYPLDKAMALNYYKKASLVGSLEGHIACGNSYWSAGDTVKAINYWSKAVEGTDPDIVPDSQRDNMADITIKLARLCQDGLLLDYDAVGCYELSVMYGNTKEAAFELGLKCLDGNEPDYGLATYYFKMAATSGQSEAYTFLGDILRILGDDDSAIAFYLKGTEYQNESAILSLAELYFDRADYDSATYWAKKCSDNENALYLLGWISYLQEDFVQAKYYWQQCVFRFHNADAITMLRYLSSDDSEGIVTNKGLIDM